MDDDTTGTVFRDVIMLALAGFVVIVLLFLPHIHPPENEESDRPPGNLIVEIIWPAERNVDVDLWVRAPGEEPVGFSSKSGTTFDLLRDDRGHLNDVSGANFEMAFSRGIPAGEYVVNLHLYSNHGASTFEPIDVAVEVRLLDEGGTRRLLRGNMTLDEVGQEITAFRFKFDQEGRFLKDTVNDDFVPLRAERGRMTVPQ